VYEDANDSVLMCLLVELGRHQRSLLAPGSRGAGEREQRDQNEGGDDAAGHQIRAPAKMDVDAGATGHSLRRMGRLAIRGRARRR
jgi:hypothetical protein